MLLPPWGPLRTIAETALLSDLQAVADAWSNLPEAIKAGILFMSKTIKGNPLPLISSEPLAHPSASEISICAGMKATRSD